MNVFETKRNVYIQNFIISTFSLASGSYAYQKTYREKLQK